MNIKTNFIFWDKYYTRRNYHNKQYNKQQKADKTTTVTFYNMSLNLRTSWSTELFSKLKYGFPPATNSKQVHQQQIL